MGVNQNSHLGAAVFVDYTKLETNLSSIMMKDKPFVHTAPSHSFVSFVWTTPPNVVQKYMQYTEALPVCIATSFERNFSNLLVQACAHKWPCISETEQAIGVKLGAMYSSTISSQPYLDFRKNSNMPGFSRQVTYHQHTKSKKEATGDVFACICLCNHSNSSV